MSESTEFELTLEFIQKLMKELVKKRQIAQNRLYIDLNQKTNLSQHDIQPIHRNGQKKPLK